MTLPKIPPNTTNPRERSARSKASFVFVMACFGVALLCLLWLLLHDLPIHREIGGNSAPGRPYVFVRDEDYCEDILVRSTDDYVYVFYYNINLVKAYDMEGNYLVSMGFQKADRRRQRAIRTMVTRGREMDLQFRSGEIYVFDGLTLSRYVPHSDPGNAALSATLAKAKNESPFFVEGGNVYRREDSGGKALFLRRALPYRLMTGRNALLCFGAVVLLLVVVTGPDALRRNRRQRRNAALGRE